MAGGMVNNKYNQIGKEILAEQEMRESENGTPMENYDGSGDEPDADEAAMMDQIDKVSRQLLSSDAFPLTDGGIQSAVEEATKRVYAESGVELDPERMSKIVNSFDYGPYTYQPETTGNQLQDSRLGLDTNTPKPEKQMRPLRRMSNK
jgi:hypothetical protein